MVGTIKDQNSIHSSQGLVVPAPKFIQPTGIDGCYLNFEQVTNSIYYNILPPGGTLQHVL